MIGSALPRSTFVWPAYSKNSQPTSTIGCTGARPFSIWNKNLVQKSSGMSAKAKPSDGFKWIPLASDLGAKCKNMSSLPLNNSVLARKKPILNIDVETLPLVPCTAVQHVEIELQQNAGGRTTAAGTFS